MRKLGWWVVGGWMVAAAAVVSEVAVRKPKWGGRQVREEVRLEAEVLKPTVTVRPTPTQVPVRSVLWEVGFTSQAPYGEWDDPRQQDGCEEAAALMMHCVGGTCPVTGGVIDKDFAKEEILKMAAWEKKNYGSFVDTSAAETGRRLLGEYWGEEYEVKKVESGEEIIRELMAGKIVVVPMNGRALANPNFTAPGPERHMVLVRGYDAQTGEVITNDPGTRKGELYRYPMRVFFEAIRDYPTGERVPIERVEKAMIVVKVS